MKMLRDFFLRYGRPSCPIWTTLEFLSRWRSRGVSVTSVRSRLRFGIDPFFLSFRSSSRGKEIKNVGSGYNPRMNAGRRIGAHERAIMALSLGLQDN